MEMYLTIYLAIGSLIIGWLLGILGNYLNHKIQRKSTRNEIKSGIKNEINELQIHLASVSLMSTCITGAFNREYFNWHKPYLLKFFESSDFIIPQNIRDTLPPISELSDDDLYNLVTAAFVTNAPRNFTYQSITTPYIDLKISEVSLFNINIQKSLFTLIRDINFLNSDVKQIWFYHSKTFDNPTQNNFAILNVNLNNLYSRIAHRSKIMVDKIEQLIKEL